MAHAFRFGVVATPQNNDQWTGLARQVADLGYSTLLMPDGLQLPSPFPSLALAAGVADLDVATFVVAAPMRPPHLVAWEAHSMTALTDGRFMLGIGTGRPAAKEFTERLGMPWGSAAERRDLVRQAVRDLRELDGDVRTPVMVAAYGPKAMDLAVETADIIALGAGPLATREEVRGVADGLREKAGDRAQDIEISMNLFSAGDDVPGWVQNAIGIDAQTLIEQDSLVLLRGSPDQMVEELQRRREEIGVSYVTVNQAGMQAMAPVVDRLKGK
ncbi:LLM class flavin-dependent oxidoreductase [Luteipulveratus mongoliensis]|uniref:5,10-methylene tetrahydromethanopterin reductase n=1 Tax=Luteipulveratus mongoliensis TaxID=571913 RepID=A0A0K1JKZ7_9MICO|nr:LLM class flavin-dependent oxidoreductase [Luteipulveratus mongoliensis]AKU17248.1 5,10-methylene tetrahydromethanopterin reductase [Luteipulveratus mongoliensis]